MVNFQKYFYAYGVGTLNLSQEMSDKMKNESGQFNHIELRKRQKCGQNWPFSLFSDILGIYYELNEHIDMNPLKSCQASSDTSLEYQQGVVWLQMARTGSKMAQKGQ